MIGAVALKLEAHQLDQAREALSTAQQVAAAGGSQAAPAVVLELSVAAEQLLDTPPSS